MSRDQKSTVIFDLDGTITRYDTYVRFLLYSLFRQPWKILRLPGLTIDVLKHKSGRKTNTWLKVRFLDALLAGQQKDRLDRWADDFATRVFSSGTYNDAIARINEHQKQNHELVLLSASLDLYVLPLGKLLGFEHIICTKTAWQNDQLDNKLEGGNCYGEVKIQRINDWRANHQDSRITLAYGDHATDFPVLKSADRGIVVNPDRKLRLKALDNNLEIISWK